MSSSEPTILILGAGTFGTSTAYHLAATYKDASRVTILDQAPSPPAPAAAIDLNRIIRTDYPSALYANLAFEAIHAWFWSLDLQRYFHRCGRLFLNEQDDDLSERILKVYAERGSTQCEELSLEALNNERWAFLGETDMKGLGVHGGYFNPEAGYCDAALATANFMAVAEKRAVKRITATVAELLLDARGGIRGVRTSSGEEFTAEKIVLATGAWTSSLLSPVEERLDIPEEERVERQVQATGRVAAYYRLTKGEVEGLLTGKGKMPVVVSGRLGEVVPPSREERVLRYNHSGIDVVNTVTVDSGQTISVPPEGRSQGDVPERLTEMVRESLSEKLLPGFTRGRQPESWRICWDARTPTEDWVVCRHPDQRLGNLYLAVGGSFHSYKFLPNFGKYMLNVLQGKSNGAEKDKAWAWKRGEEWEGKRERMREKGRELRDLEREGGGGSTERPGGLAKL